MVVHNFKVDSEVKQEFLSNKPKNTAKSYGYVLKKVDGHEKLIGVPVYNMTIPQLKEMFFMQFKNPTLNDVSKNASIIRTYIDFCIEKNIVMHYENRMRLLAGKNLKEFVSKFEKENRYIPLEKLRFYQSKLYNAQDVAILEAFYNGIRGRAEEEHSMEELINLRIDENSGLFRNNEIELVRNDGHRRIIKVSDHTMQIFLDAKRQDTYYSSNGVPDINNKLKKIFIPKIKNYVFRTPKSKEQSLFKKYLVYNRMEKIKEWVGDSNLTPHTLYISGIIDMAKKIIEKKGEITQTDYELIIERYPYGENIGRKRYSTREIIESYLGKGLK